MFEESDTNFMIENWWMMTEEEWLHMIKGRVDSMPGEDGIPYSVWRVSAAGRLLYDCYCAFFQNPRAGIPHDMMSSLMVFSPKKLQNMRWGKGYYASQRLPDP